MPLSFISPPFASTRLRIAEAAVISPPIFSHMSLYKALVDEYRRRYFTIICADARRMSITPTFDLIFPPGKHAMEAGITPKHRARNSSRGRRADAARLGAAAIKSQLRDTQALMPTFAFDFQHAKL